MTKIDLSAGGRLEVSPFVNQAKIQEMSKIISDMTTGGFEAEFARTRFKQSLSTTDAIFSLAQLINIRNLPNYDEAPRQWTKIANVETVDDFKPATFYSLKTNFSNLEFGKDNNGARVSPRVAEGDTYQYAYGYTEESVQVAIEKRGFKWGITLEAIINDPSRQVRNVPTDMLQIALDTDEFLVFRALQDGAVSGTQLQAGTAIIGGQAIPANAPFSAEAARLGLKQVAQRVDADNNRIPLAPSYYVVTALGNGDSFEAELERARAIIQFNDGQIVYGATGTNQYINRISGVIESEFITDTDAWYLVPAAGSTRRPSLVKLNLAGRTSPEVLVNNFTGTPLSGGSGSSAFQLAHFDNDTVDLKLRQFTNSAMITDDQLVWSNGSGS